MYLNIFKTAPGYRPTLGYMVSLNDNGEIFPSHSGSHVVGVVTGMQDYDEAIVECQFAAAQIQADEVQMKTQAVYGMGNRILGYTRVGKFNVAQPNNYDEQLRTAAAVAHADAAIERFLSYEDD